MNLIGIYMMAIIQYILSLTLFQIGYHLIGAFLIVNLIKLIIFSVWAIIKEFIPLNNILKKYSYSEQEICWAVITGATDGIGLGFAQILIKLGFNICLISRNQQKLTKTIANLKQIQPQQFKQRKIISIQFDFTQSSDQSKFQEVFQKLSKLDIGIFVNNVGTALMKDYERFTYQQIKDIINVNCTSTSVLSGYIMKHFKDRKAKSALINVSSFMAEGVVPYATLYSATKSMITILTETISLQHPSIDILSFRPLFVETKLSGQKKGLFVPDRRQCAYACLKELQWEYETNGTLSHKILAKIHQLFVPKFLHRKVSKYGVKLLMGSSFD